MSTKLEVTVRCFDNSEAVLTAMIKVADVKGFVQRMIELCTAEEKVLFSNVGSASVSAPTQPLKTRSPRPASVVGQKRATR